MSISLNYSVSARDVLTHPEIGARLRQMKRAGVEHVWLDGYFYGHHESELEQLYQARLRLLNEGFETGVISVPVGHPGNSLNPDDPTLDLSIPPDWRYRVNRHGQKEYFSACIDETMTRHNHDAAMLYAQMGFTRHFLDDDLRLGNWGDQVQGCFCDRCIDVFNRHTGLQLTRQELAAACDSAPGMEPVREAWIRYNCDKVTDFVKTVQIPGMTGGVMVMHNGGRNHGISIPDIRRAVPGCMFRVGEMYFSDASFTQPGAQESLAGSVRSHLSLIGDNPAYSETTVFPAAAMSPDNFLRRIRLELRLGLRNLFLMSGTWFFSDPYWNALSSARPELEALAAQLDSENALQS